MTTRRRLAAWLLAAILLVPGPASAQPSSRLSGTVQDASGAPLPGTTVTLSGADDRIAHTAPDGSFEFQTLPEGDYELEAILPGFVPIQRTFRLAGTDPLILSLTLPVQFIEQMVVTAAKTGERDAQATPIAMSVLPARELELVQAHTIEDAARQAPSVTFSQNTGLAQLTIRGIGTNAVFTGSDPSSAVYLDGVYLARPAMILSDFLDLERLEVLRGPQGTLYGRNAVGGALNVITKPPTNDLQASARLVGGTSRTLRADARINGPIVPDRIMGSAAVLRGVARGFVRDLQLSENYLGGDDVTAASAKLRFVLNQRSDLLVSGDVMQQTQTPLTYAKVLEVKPGFQIDNPEDLHEVRTSTRGDGRILQYGGAVRLTTQMTPRTTMTSLTAFRKLDFDVLVDTDITELELTASDVHEIQHQWSEELTVSHQRPGLGWLVGVFLFDDHDRQPTTIRLGAPLVQNRLNPLVEANSKAVFGQTTIGIARRMSATAGLRYTNEAKTISNEGELLSLNVPPIRVVGSAYSYTDRLSHTAWTPKVGLDVRVDDRTLSYVSATRGFKSGGFNISSTEPGRGFAPEWAWSYEAGVKTTVAGGRARLNVAGFYTDYSNLQVQIAIRPGVLDISNAAAATIKGIELENLTEASRSFRFGGYLTWLDARYDQYTAVGVGGVLGDAAGHHLNNAPEWSGRAWLEWNRGVQGGRTLAVRPEVVWQSTAFFTAFNDSVQRQPGYPLVNLSAEVRPSRGCCTVALYARNLTNEDYITGTFSSPPPAIGGRPGSPREIGVELTIGR